MWNMFIFIFYKNGMVKMTPEQEKQAAIKEARIHFDHAFPKDLWTGILFFKGFRITREEFENE